MLKNGASVEISR